MVSRRKKSEEEKLSPAASVENLSGQMMDGEIGSEDQESEGEMPPPTGAPLALERETYLVKPIPSAVELKLKIAAEEKRIEALEETLSSTRLKTANRAGLLERIQSTRAGAVEWLSEVQDSFIWRAKARLAQERSKAKALLDSMAQDVATAKLPEPGELSKMQRQFTKNFLVSTVGPVIIMLIVTVIPWVVTIPPIRELAFLYEPETAGPFIVLLILGLLFVSAFIVYLFNRDKFPTAKFLIWVVALAVFGFLIFQLNFLAPWVREVLAPFLSEAFWAFLTFSLLLFAAGVLVSLIIYYSGWSKFRREVDLQSVKLQNIGSGYAATQVEMRRLELIHLQADSWFELIASAVHRPWKVDPRWLQEASTAYELEGMPSALRIAKAVESGDSKTSALERKIAETLLVRGWRNDAFEEMVLGVGKAIGLAKNTFSVDTLDNDLPHLPNNHRAIVRSFLDRTASNERLNHLDFDAPRMDPTMPGGFLSTDRYLREIALDRVRTLLRDAQSNTISAERPDVEAVSTRKGNSFEFDETGFDEISHKKSWDEFLSESLGTVDDAQPPLSPMVFTTAGKAKRVHERLSSFLLVPPRIQSTIPKVRTQTISLVAAGDSKPRRVEILARVDLSESVDAEHLTLFTKPSKAETSFDDERSGQTVTACPTCGFQSCAATKDPAAKCSEGRRL